MLHHEAKLSVSPMYSLLFLLMHPAMNGCGLIMSQREGRRAVRPLHTDSQTALGFSSLSLCTVGTLLEVCQDKRKGDTETD